MSTIGANKPECISTPWVRLFSRYTVYYEFLYTRNLIVTTIIVFFRVTLVSLAANDGDLLVGDPHQLPVSASALRPEIRDRYRRGSFLRVERLGVSI